MKVPSSEDPASYTGPEPHGGCGNTMAAAWVGGSASMLHGYRVTGTLTATDCQYLTFVESPVSTIPVLDCR